MRNGFPVRATCLSAVLIAAPCAAQSTSLASLSSAGAQGDGPSAIVSFTPDARYVVFVSSASNLVAGDTNASIDVFRRDRITSTTIRVSVATSGAEGNTHAGWHDVSSDGRYVVFETLASNLASGDTNLSPDVFVRDVTTSTTTLVSVTSSGVPGDNYCARPTISANGRWVAFASLATNLVSGDTNGAYDIFVRDVQLGTTVRASVSSTGAEANGGSINHEIADDGRWVAFTSAASNLVLGDTNGEPDVFLHDLQTGATMLVSAGLLGTPANGPSSWCSISGDGRVVAYSSQASNLVPGDTNGADDVFVHDTLSGFVSRASLDDQGGQGDGVCDFVRLSPDGRWVAFSSYSTNVVAGDTNFAYDVFQRDLHSGTTALVSVATTGGTGSSHSTFCKPSGSGRYVAFSSLSSNLVAGDTNGDEDVFVRDRGALVAHRAFCAGDGSGGICPCGNVSPAGSLEGCLSSLGTGGKLVATGNAVLGNDSLLLSGSGMPSSSALYFQGTAMINGGLGSPFGDGLRCAGGSVIRLATKINVAGASQYPGIGDQPVSVQGQVTAGTRTYQVWYRNAAAFCTASTFNLTNGVLVTWDPCTTCL